MSDGGRSAARLTRLHRLADLLASAECARLGRTLRDEARLSAQVASLVAERRAAARGLSCAPDDAPARPKKGAETSANVAFVLSTAAWLRRSEEDLRRLNIQLAALRARSETARRDAARATAREAVLRTLARRARAGRSG